MLQTSPTILQTELASRVFMGEKVLFWEKVINLENMNCGGSYFIISQPIRLK